MNDALQMDIELRPGLFYRTGSADPTAITRIIAATPVAIPDDVLDIWRRWGAVEMFETEKLYAPGIAFSWSVELSDQNDVLRDAGMPRNYVVIGYTFGNWLAIDGATGLLSEVADSGDFAVLRTFTSMDDWYVNYERAEYARKYGLPPLDGDEPTVYQV